MRFSILKENMRPEWVATLNEQDLIRFNDVEMDININNVVVKRDMVKVTATILDTDKFVFNPKVVSNGDPVDMIFIGLEAEED